MTKEARTDVYHTCEEHASRPQAKYLTMPDERFVSNFVYRSFDVKDSHRKEHCWIYVTAIVSPGFFVGRLNNDPVEDIGFCCGQLVSVQKEQIERAMDAQTAEFF